MRFMVMIKANEESEAGVLPSKELLSEMMDYNEKLVKAGIMKAGEGLQPSSKGARVAFHKGGRMSVTDGPFAETKELLAGFWIWDVSSKQEAIDWVKRMPNPGGEESEVEIRQVFESDDFGENMSPELKAKEAELRSAVEGK